MNSLNKFLKYSSQFHNISNRLFNNQIKLDHYAYRTFDINTIISKYKHYKKESDEYIFPNNVTAIWLSHPEKPSIFVSQYNGIINDKKIKNETNIRLDKLHYYIKNNTPIEYEFYKKINEHNQYLAWTLLFRNNINHVAFLVDDIHECCHNVVSEFPEYTLTNPENPIQISEDKELLQFAIKADLIDYKFMDGIHQVPFSFIEFVERKNGRIGFENANAAKIFESTK